jgi:hypothetical protein
VSEPSDLVQTASGLAGQLHGAWVRFATTGDPTRQGEHRFTG